MLLIKEISIPFSLIISDICNGLIIGIEGNTNIEGKQGMVMHVIIYL